MPVGHRGPAALAARRPAIAPGHLGRGPGFVDKDEPGRIEISLPVKPELPCRFYVAALLLARMRRLFLNVMRRALKKVQTVAGQTET